MPKGALGPTRDHPVSVLLRMLEDRRNRLRVMLEAGPGSFPNVMAFMNAHEALQSGIFSMQLRVLGRGNRMILADFLRELGDDALAGVTVLDEDQTPEPPPARELEPRPPPDPVELLVDALTAAPAGPPRLLTRSTGR